MCTCRISFPTIRRLCAGDLLFQFVRCLAVLFAWSHVNRLPNSTLHNSYVTILRQINPFWNDACRYSFFTRLWDVLQSSPGHCNYIPQSCCHVLLSVSVILLGRLSLCILIRSPIASMWTVSRISVFYGHTLVGCGHPVLLLYGRTWYFLPAVASNVNRFSWHAGVA